MLLVVISVLIAAAIMVAGVAFTLYFPEMSAPRRRLVLALVLTVPLTSLAVVFAGEKPFKSSELNIYDFFVRLRGARTPRPEILICAVDNATRRALGSVDPVPRKKMAQAITKLADAGASVIAIDYTFSRADRSGSKELAEAIADANCVVLAMSVQSGQLYFSDGLFRESAIAEGLINVDTDPDGSLRRVKLLRATSWAKDPAESEVYLAFPAAALLAYLEIDNLDHIHGVRESAPEIRFDKYEQKIVGTDEEGYDIYEYTGKMERAYHIPSSGFFINYLGPAETVPHLSLCDVLSGEFNESEVDGRIVFIGDTRLAGSDVFDTPFNIHRRKTFGKGMEEIRLAQMPGIEVHANILATILDANEPHASERYAAYVTWFDGPYYMLLLALLGLLFGYVFCYARLPAVASVAIFALLAGGGFLLSIYLFSFPRGVFLPAVPVLFLLASMFVGGTFLRWLLDRIRNRRIISQWGRYMSRNIVDKIVAGELTVNTKGHEKELTLLFSDIRGFTTVSEGLGAEGIARLLNAFFNRMLACVFETDGTIDKLMGDCIMSFWNDPDDQPDHRRRACETALRMMEELHRFREENPVPGADKINIGIGLNSGPATAGDLGADFYSDYTALGDTVNTASRLEGINKYYRSNIIISRETYEPVRDLFAARYVDTIRVKGRDKPVEIFELLCHRKDFSGPVREKAESFAEIREVYEKHEWERATEMFRKHLEKFPDDGPASVLLERAEKFILHPPPSYWDGVHDFETK